MSQNLSRGRRHACNWGPLLYAEPKEHDLIAVHSGSSSLISRIQWHRLWGQFHTKRRRSKIKVRYLMLNVDTSPRIEREAKEPCVVPIFIKIRYSARPVLQAGCPKIIPCANLLTWHCWHWMRILMTFMPTQRTAADGAIGL